MSSVLLRTALTAFAAVIGALLGLSLGRAAQARLNLLVYAAAGTLLAVVLCDVLPDAKSALSWTQFTFAVGGGYTLFYLFNRYVYHICPACTFSDFDSETTEKLGQTAILLLFALGLHSMLDGLALVVGDTINHQNSAAFLLALTLHKLPEGLALVLLLLAAGYTRQAALLWTTGIEATTVLGGVLGLLVLRGASPGLIGLLFAHVGGGFLFLMAGTFRALRENKTQFSVRPLVLVSSLTFAGMASLLCLIRAYAF